MGRPTLWTWITWVKIQQIQDIYHRKIQNNDKKSLKKQKLVHHRKADQAEANDIA